MIDGEELVNPGVPCQAGGQGLAKVDDEKC